MRRGWVRAAAVVQQEVRVTHATSGLAVERRARLSGIRRPERRT